MDNLWKGIAIAGIWLGIGLTAFAGVDSEAIGFIGMFAAIASIFIGVTRS